MTQKQYTLSQQELRQIQLIELEMLIEVNRICVKHDIKYCISAGTLLGAVRHGGYIPWDDDADVAFLRKEYIRFREICKTELDSERFYLQDHETTKGYRWGYGKLRRKGTEFVRLNQESMPYNQEIFIDLMQYDYVPDNFTKRKFHALKCYLYRKSFYARIGKTSSTGAVKVLFTLLDLIPDNLLFNSYQSFVKKSNIKPTNRVRILTLPVPGNQNGYQTKWLVNTKNILFEDVELVGMEFSHDYLSYKYGNYMTLPPQNERKTHPISKLKLLIKTQST
jgi:lipopolysaccharide cholinephosphotransferase